MIARIIDDYLPATASYIRNIFATNSDARGKHHNTVIVQKLTNLAPSISDLPQSKIQKLDRKMLDYLIHLDK